MTMSRRGRNPWRAQCRTTALTWATVFFMSTAPRPHSTGSPVTGQSAISPAKGGSVQSRAWAGTTSRWPWTSSAGALGSVPGTRTIVFARRGADSSTCGSRPPTLRASATNSATGPSSPSPAPWLVESRRISSRVRWMASSPASRKPSVRSGVENTVWPTGTASLAASDGDLTHTLTIGWGRGVHSGSSPRARPWLSAVVGLHRPRDECGDHLEAADHLVGVRGRVPDAQYVRARHPRDQGRCLGQVGRVDLYVQGHGAWLGGFRPFGECHGPLCVLADVGGCARGWAAARRVPAHVVLHRDLAGKGGVGVGVLTGPVVPGHQDHGGAVLGDHGRVEVALARRLPVQPDPGDGVGQVGVGEHPVVPRAAVVAQEDDPVDVTGLDSLDHGQLLVPSGDHLGPLVESFQQQVAHGRVRLVDQHFGGTTGEEALHGGVDVAGEHRPAALPLLGAGFAVGGPGDAGGAFHVGGDEDLHAAEATPRTVGDPWLLSGVITTEHTDDEVAGTNYNRCS